MDARQFVACWKNEKDACLSAIRNRESSAGRQLEDIGLNMEQSERLWAAFDTALTDVFYTLLLGLDGCAQIGGVQESFQIRDEAGNLISKDGDIEAEAYKQFQAKA